MRTTTTITTTKVDFSSPRLPAPDASQIEQQLHQLAGKRVAVAMSGGVDSAVAALRLVNAGADVIGLSLRLHDPDPQNPLAPRACCPPDDLQDARRVAEFLDIPFYVIDARSSFTSDVVDPFVRSYLAGKTPNPCVGCNAFVKLERLHKRARGLGCAALATGHFARNIRVGDFVHLYTGVDEAKDQSYFLFSTGKEILRDLIFPLGASTKAEVRDQAMSAGLPVAHKLESQEVCFVGGAGAGRFVMGRAEAQGNHKGTIVDESGVKLGEHPGVMHFTVGQRKGIGLAARHPLHVLSIDSGNKTVTVGSADRLMKTGLKAAKASWPAGLPSQPFEATVRIRYRDKGTAATVYPVGEDRVEVRFNMPVRAIAPGQATVFYVGEEVAGGAWIEDSFS